MLIANEIVDFKTKLIKARVVCKLDIEKAYDHINRGFLIYIMRRMPGRDRLLGFTITFLLLPLQC